MARGSDNATPRSREELFKESSEIFFLHNRLIAEFCTGAGKTYAALKLIDLSCKSNPSEKWVIAYPRVSLKKSWIDEIKKWKLDHLLDRITLTTYDSLHKINGNYNVCLDEAHNITELRLEKIVNFVSKKSRMIALSATIDEKEKKDYLRELGFDFKRHRVVFELDEGVKSGVVTDYKIWKCPIEANEWWRKAYKKKTRIIDAAKRKGNQKFIQFAMLSRMRHVYDSFQKIQAAEYLIKKTIGKRDKVLVFVSNKNAADYLSERTGYPAYHSGLSTKEREKILNEFNEAKSGALISINTLNEGVTIKGANKAYIIQVRSKKREAIQRIGRILRFLGKLDGEIGKVIITYIADSRDENWTNDAVFAFDQSKVETFFMPKKWYESSLGILPKPEE
jgi:superfamily II DNA or RNA helicase